MAPSTQLLMAFANFMSLAVFSEIIVVIVAVVLLLGGDFFILLRYLTEYISMACVET